MMIINLTYLLIGLFTAMIIPVIGLVIILGRKFFQHDGNVAALRRVIFLGALGKVLLIFMEIFVLMAIVSPNIKFSSMASIIGLNIVAFITTIINWWAVYAVLKIRSNL